jgi:2-dehydro-3-deoxyglucarate aldolase
MWGYNCSPIIRVQSNDPVAIKRALDIGSHGVLIPWVNSKSEAEAAVAACRYPPQGIRGCGPRRAKFVGGNDYITTANRDLLIAVQIETANAIRNIDEILSVDGIDVAYIGPMDLSMSMFGMPKAWNESGYLESFDKVLKAAKQAGKSTGMYCSLDNIDWAIEKGFKFNSIDNADRFLMTAARAALSKARNAIGKVDSGRSQ